MRRFALSYSGITKPSAVACSRTTSHARLGDNRFGLTAPPSAPTLHGMDFWWTLAILLLGGVIAWAARLLALQGRLGLGPRKFVAIFLPTPADYSVPLQASELDLTREGSRTTLKMRHKYAGKYWVQISVPQQIPNPLRRPEAEFKLLLEFFVRGKPALR